MMNKKKEYIVPTMVVCTRFANELMVVYDPTVSTNMQLTPGQRFTDIVDDELPDNKNLEASIWDI